MIKWLPRPTWQMARMVMMYLPSVIRYLCEKIPDSMQEKSQNDKTYFEKMPKIVQYDRMLTKAYLANGKDGYDVLAKCNQVCTYVKKYQIQCRQRVKITKLISKKYQKLYKIKWLPKPTWPMCLKCPLERVRGSNLGQMSSTQLLNGP